MANIRIQVSLNGRELCIAGLDEHGTLSVTIEATRVPDVPDPVLPSQKTPDVVHNELRVGAQTWARDDSLQWAATPLKPGDEIIVRVLGEGPYDEPAERIANEVF